MAAQNFVSAPARDNSFKNPSNNDGPSIGLTTVKGFCSGKADGSTINGGGSVGKSPQTVGSAVKGFSDGGLIDGKI